MNTSFQMRLFPMLVISFLILMSGIFLLTHPFSLENLQDMQFNVQNFHSNHPITTIFLFMLVYILYAVLPIPGIFILSLAAGFLFHQPFSTLYVAMSATIGASLLYLTARTTFGELFYRPSSRFLTRLEKGFHENAISYLLFLRLVPLFPFWIVNVAGALFGVSFWIFAWTTFIGMLPSVFIYTQAGRGLTLLLQNSDPLNPAHFFNPPILIALIGLAALSLLPIWLKSIK